MISKWNHTCFTSTKLVVQFHCALTSIWNGDNQVLVTEALLTITMRFADIFWPSPKIWNGDGQQMPSYIHINIDSPQRSITINHCFWYEMVTIIIRHYSHYSWRTVNVTIMPILLAMHLLVTVNEHHNIYAPIVTAIKDPSQ